MYETVFYQAPRGDYPVLDFIKTLDKKARAKIYRYIELLEKEGPNLLRPYAASRQREDSRTARKIFL